MTPRSRLASAPSRGRWWSYLLRGGLLLSFALPIAQAAGLRKVIVDDDITGVRAATLMAIQAPDVEVLGLTIVSGSVWRDEAVAHALRTLEIAGRSEIPVVPSAVFPLVNSELATKRWEALYGKLVYKGAWMDESWPEGTLQSQPLYHRYDAVPNLPEGNPQTKASTEIAANFLIRQVHEHPGEVSIIATGPLTNLALAIKLDPDFAAIAKELVYMGGSFNPQQKRTSVSAQQFGREYANTPRLEFNFRWDPEAARIVLRAPWKKIVAVPVDPSTATELTPALLQALSTASTPLARAYRKFNETGFPRWDEIALAVWLDPTLIKRGDQLDVDVDCTFAAGYGNTLSWPTGKGPGLGEQANLVVREVDVEKMEKLMIALLNRPTPAAR